MLRDVLIYVSNIVIDLYFHLCFLFPVIMNRFYGVI